jgi:hypothetical protein
MAEAWAWRVVRGTFGESKDTGGGGWFGSAVITPPFGVETRLVAGGSAGGVAAGVMVVVGRSAEVTGGAGVNTLEGGVAGCGCGVAACAEGIIAGTVKSLAEATVGTAATAMMSAIFRMVEVSIIEPSPS